jgi:hypothetical protein
VCAQVVCEQLKVQSQNDTAKLAEAKQMVYLKVTAVITLLHNMLCNMVQSAAPLPVLRVAGCRDMQHSTGFGNS